jgi:hypothetical protein
MTDNPNQEETTDIDNQDPLKAWTLFLTEKENNVRKKFIKQTNPREDYKQPRLRKNSRKHLRMSDSDREEDDYLKKFMDSTCYCYFFS